MNRVVKAAVAVTAFGLAAALAVPAQAEVQYNTARYAPTDVVGDAANLAGSPLGLLGGVTGGGLLGGLLGGVTKGKSAARSAAAKTGQMIEAQRDAAFAARKGRRAGDPNAAEDVTRLGGPLPEVSPIVGQLSPVGGSGLTQSLPARSGAARLAQPATSVKTARQSQGATDAFNSATKGFDSLTSNSTLAGLTQAARNALPSLTKGELSQMVGQVAPSEIAPVAEALPGTTHAASMDELNPLVEEASGAVSTKGTTAVGSYGDLMTALGWTSNALTSSVRDSWVHE
ncbi:hypothetical protein EDD27_8149 [Nonomuraea polychroma]|uniref:Uncharacterized protein n=1 Tax=Nonomuraea polychroma TaxID=46176 RepID=A0A438MHL8_9ACTN|nr:hypothetical protein [Nonomuraea polychroma]RVX45360.1 hypothetical protein EDD27_8149 [Nonomuraea polychroma]